MDLSQFLLPGVAVGDPDLGPMPAQDPGGHRPGAMVCSTACSEWNTHCQWVTPSTRVVVSSEAITGAPRSLALIAAQAVSNAVPMRRKALAMAPSEMLSPNNSFSIRESRSKPT